MSIDDKNKTESPDIIEEIIPGKNNDDNDKSMNQNNNNNHQSSIENYDEEQSAHSVLEVSESKESIERNTEKASNPTHPYVQAITDTEEQTAQATKALAENYLELQKQILNSFQSVFMPYFGNIQKQFWNNQDFFKSIPEMYSRLVSNYSESAIAFSKMWNDIAFSNAGLFRNASKKTNE